MLFALSILILQKVVEDTPDIWAGYKRFHDFNSTADTPMKFEHSKRVLKFRRPYTTSRGSIPERIVWIIKFSDDLETRGEGEVAPFPNLSPETEIEVEERLEELGQKNWGSLTLDSHREIFDVSKELSAGIASIRFGLETALLDLFNGGRGIIFLNKYSRGQETIACNGLAFSNGNKSITAQVDDLVEAGFQTVKIKIPLKSFESDLKTLTGIREKHPNLTIRLDANEGFNPSLVLSQIRKLAPLGIDSLEQPILTRQPEALKLICEKSSIPIALDEELVGFQNFEEKKNFLSNILPGCLVLKPSLLGGIEATNEWIRLAESLSIRWWITSTLESNKGLDKVAQYVGELRQGRCHGLATLDMYEKNFTVPYKIIKGRVHRNLNSGDPFAENDFLSKNE